MKPKGRFLVVVLHKVGSDLHYFYVYGETEADCVDLLAANCDFVKKFPPHSFVGQETFIVPRDFA